MLAQARWLGVLTSAVRAIEEGAVVGGAGGCAVLWTPERGVDDLDLTRGTGVAVVGMASAAGATDAIARVASASVKIVVGSVV